MHHHYKDIRERIAGEPLWFDENGVPRYCEFTPRDAANIYANQIALVLIRCQQCQREFKVAFSWSMNDYICGRPSLVDEITSGSIHYGDPPNIECCPAGPTMNCDDLRVLEFWRNDERGLEKVRDPSLEIVLPDGEEDQTC
jgi:hypothetical protein